MTVKKKETDQKTKKPLYKKWWFWLIVICLLGAVGSTLPGDDKPSEPSTGQTESQAPAPSQKPEDPAVATEPDSNVRKALDDVLGNTTFYENVRNDVTGKWRALVFYSAENIVDHAVEYYNAYFSSDDEVHIAVNLGLKTTSAMTVSNGMMYIDVHEYIDKEEHDAKIMCSGKLLKHYAVNLETGEIKDLSATD